MKSLLIRMIIIGLLLVVIPKSYSMQTVKLKNGTEIQNVILVRTTWMNLKALLHKDPIAFYELVMKCRDENHELWGNTGEVISSLFGPIEGMSRCIKDVVLSSAEGEGMDMALTSPYSAETREELSYEKTISTCAAVQQLPLDFLRNYYARLQDIAKFIIREMNTDGMTLSDRTTDSPNPFYNQIVPDGSVALEMYYGSPSKFWTPLGALEISGGGSVPSGCTRKRRMSIIKERLKLVKIIPGKQHDWGYYGPVYKISNDLNGERFTGEITPIKDRSQMIPYDDAKELWKKVKPDGRN